MFKNVLECLFVFVDRYNANRRPTQVFFSHKIAKNDKMIN